MLNIFKNIKFAFFPFYSFSVVFPSPDGDCASCIVNTAHNEKLILLTRELQTFSIYGLYTTLVESAAH